LIALIITIAYLIIRRLISFEEAMKSISQGFIAMVPAILILTFATGLKNVTGLLDLSSFVKETMAEFPAELAVFLPAVVFLIACVLAFSTGTSWGTFGILIPIVLDVFAEGHQELLFVGISACLAGAVCGDHCSPISDTTIMASAGANCNHVDHVSTQLPYAMTVAAISFVSFLVAGFIPNAIICLLFSTILTVTTLLVIRLVLKKKGKA
jgi:Na+/H+ antiporter NhaC